jgi:hypothetical protein
VKLPAAAASTTDSSPCRFFMGFVQLAVEDGSNGIVFAAHGPVPTVAGIPTSTSEKKR